MRTLTILNGLALATAVLAAGCASTGRQRSDHLADSIHDTAIAVDDCGNSRTAALDSMDALAAAPAGELSSKFATFSSSVDRAVAADGSLRAAVASMKDSARVRNERWGADNVTYADNDMQVRAQRSRAEAAESFRRMEVETDAMLGKSAEFVVYLSDLRKILSNDLSMHGVENTKGFVKKARASGADLDGMSATVRESLGKTAAAMDNDVASN